jgi:hypothetical protein
MNCRHDRRPRVWNLASARGLLHCCVLLVLGSTSAEAGLVFDNGSPDFQDGHGSDFDAFTYPGGQFLSQVADDFSLPASASTITGITWWGDYGTTGAPPQTEDFTIRFFNDVNGMAAATPFASFDVGGGNRTAMGLNIYTSPGYSYSATIAPLILSPNTTYWLSIVDDTRADSTQNFYWATSHWTHGDGLIRNGGDDTPWRSINQGFGGVEEAFQLTEDVAQTPEPTSLVLYGMGCFLVGCHRALRTRFRRARGQ